MMRNTIKQNMYFCVFMFFYVYHDLRIGPRNLVVSDLAAGWKDEKLKEPTRINKQHRIEVCRGINWTTSPKHGIWSQLSRSAFLLNMKSKADIRELSAGSFFGGYSASSSYWFRDSPLVRRSVVLCKWIQTTPIPSMYGIFTYIYHKNQPNVATWMVWDMANHEKTHNTETPTGTSENPLSIPFGWLNCMR